MFLRVVQNAYDSVGVMSMVCTIVMMSFSWTILTSKARASPPPPPQIRYSGFCFSSLSVSFKMAATEPKAVSEVAKMDLFEDDDEFEEFDINEEWEDKEEGKEVTQQWEDDWDDDDVNDDFSLQLRRELENNTEKKD
ncbi:hypothetical protein ACLB2K_043832 [Fragaria x ananassa]